MNSSDDKAKLDSLHLYGLLDDSLDAEDAARLERACKYAQEVLHHVETAPKIGILKRDLNDSESILAWAVDYLSDVVEGMKGALKGVARAQHSSITAQGPTPRTDKIRDKWMRECHVLMGLIPQPLRTTIAATFWMMAETSANHERRVDQIERELAAAADALVVEKSRATDLALELEKAQRKLTNALKEAAINAENFHVTNQAYVKMDERRIGLERELAAVQADLSRALENHSADLSQRTEGVTK